MNAEQFGDVLPAQLTASVVAFYELPARPSLQRFPLLLTSFTQNTLTDGIERPAHPHLSFFKEGPSAARIPLIENELSVFESTCDDGELSSSNNDGFTSRSSRQAARGCHRLPSSPPFVACVTSS
jgi:hypothetical protein